MGSTNTREILSAIVVFLALLLLLYTVVIRLADLVIPDAFEPLTVNELVVLNNLVVSGNMLEIRDGICNTTRKELDIDLHVKMQREVVATETPLQESAFNLYGPAKITLFPGCLATQPVTLTVPVVPAGIYFLSMEVLTTSKDGKEQQTEIRASNTFEVINSE